jgi:hypothetical protein
MLLHGQNAVPVVSTSPQNFYQCIVINIVIHIVICTLDTGHFRLYAAIQSLKNDHLPNKEFEPTNECFNAVYQI